MGELQLDLARIIRSCAERLYIHDKHLIDTHSSEMSIVFRLGVYVEELLKNTAINGLNVDCEYNRNRGYSKRIHINDEERDALFRPDLIIHQRDSNDHNLLAVEAKGYWNREERERDFQKLRSLTMPDRGYEYKLGVFLELLEEKPNFVHFIKGEEVKIDG